MALNTLFPRAKELVNYDYFDIAEGVGVTVYFGLKGDDGEYFVSSSSTVASEAIATFLDEETLTASFVKKFDLDFDLTFNRPKNIKGSLLGNIPIGISAVDDLAKTIEYYCVMKVYHYDGSTETLLATGQSETINQGLLQTSLRSFNAMLALCHADITTIKHFKKGETLRFSIEGWYKKIDGTGTVHCMICHDPANRPWQSGKRPQDVASLNEFANEPTGGGSLSYERTQMTFHVPFILDV